MQLTQQEREKIIDTLMGEARGEGYVGMAGVAKVILNRVNQRGLPVSRVITKSQFAGSGYKGGDKKTRAMAERALDDVLAGEDPAGVGVADHFARSDVSNKWTREYANTAKRVGQHKFYSSPRARVADALDLTNIAQAPKVKPVEGVTTIAKAPAADPFDAVLANKWLSELGFAASPAYELDNLTANAANKADLPVTGLVMHHTTIPTIARADDYFSRDNTKLGYTAVIDEGGNVSQLHPADVRTNHAAKQKRGVDKRLNTPSGEKLWSGNSIGLSLLGADKNPTEEQILSVMDFVNEFNEVKNNEGNELYSAGSFDRAAKEYANVIYPGSAVGHGKGALLAQANDPFLGYAPQAQPKAYGAYEGVQAAGYVNELLQPSGPPSRPNNAPTEAGYPTGPSTRPNNGPSAIEAVQSLFSEPSRRPNNRPSALEVAEEYFSQPSRRPNNRPSAMEAAEELLSQPGHMADIVRDQAREEVAIESDPRNRVNRMTPDNAHMPRTTVQLMGELGAPDTAMPNPLDAISVLDDLPPVSSEFGFPSGPASRPNNRPSAIEALNSAPLPSVANIPELPRAADVPLPDRKPELAPIIPDLNEAADVLKDQSRIDTPEAGILDIPGTTIAKSDRKEKKKGNAAVAVAGAVLGGLAGGLPGAIAGGRLGYKHGNKIAGAIPTVAGIPFNELLPHGFVSQQGFRQTPAGAASWAYSNSNAPTAQGRSADYWGAYSAMGGRSDSGSMARAMAEEQRVRNERGDRTLSEMLDGLF